MTEGHVNPAQWDWKHWPFSIDFGSVLDPTPLLDTLVSMARALPHLFTDDAREGRLRAAAQAHDTAYTSLQTIYDALDQKSGKRKSGNLDTVLQEWKGEAADRFRAIYAEIVKHENRVIFETTFPTISAALKVFTDMSRATRTALLGLIREALFWAAAFMTLRWAALTFAGRLAQVVAYLRTRAAVVNAMRILAEFARVIKPVGDLLRKLPALKKIMKGGDVVKNLDKANALSKLELKNVTYQKYLARFAAMGTKTFKSYAKMSGWAYAGIMGTDMVAHGLSGRSVFDVDPVTFQQAGYITTGSLVVATFAPVASIFGKGLGQGAAAATHAATITKTGQAVAESGEAFAALASIRNTTYEKLKQSLPTVRPRDAKGNKVYGDGHKQFWQGVPTSLFRVWRPLHNAPDYADMPDWEPPSKGKDPGPAPATTPAPAPAQHQETRKVGYRSAANSTLWGIAQEVYHDPTRYMEIYHANQDVIGPDPRVLLPNVTLKIPLDD